MYTSAKTKLRMALGIWPQKRVLLDFFNGSSAFDHDCIVAVDELVFVGLDSHGVCQSRIHIVFVYYKTGNQTL